MASCKCAPSLRNSLSLRQIMRVASLLTIVGVLLSPMVMAPTCHAARPARHVPQTPSGDAFPNKSIIIYVADFDLEATHAPGSSGGSSNRNVNSPTTPSPSPVSATPSASPPAGPAATTDSQKSEGQKSDSARADAQTADAAKADASKIDSAKVDPVKVDPQTDDSPRAQAAKLVDLTSSTLVKVLEQEGYSVRRLKSGASPPDSGVIIRGVFAQVDQNFGIRRVVIGGLVTDPKMLVFVGIGNLARPEQALYAVVSPQPADNLGPLISVSAYAPIGRYELDRDPSEELLRRTATNIAGDLTRLLNANPLALEQ
jgi:hypothetical protein